MFHVRLSSQDMSLPASTGTYHTFSMAQSVARSWVKKHKGTAYAQLESDDGTTVYQWRQNRVTSHFVDACTGTVII